MEGFGYGKPPRPALPVTWFNRIMATNDKKPAKPAKNEATVLVTDLYPFQDQAQRKRKRGKNHLERGKASRTKVSMDSPT